MNKSGIELDDLDLAEFRAFITDASKILQNGGERTAKAWAREVQQGARERAPFRHGDLEDSIKMKVSSSAGGKVRAEVWVDTSVAPYAVHMHEGIPIGTPFQLGPGSQAKNVGTPHTGVGVGWKFLTRAFNATYREYLKLTNKLLEDVKRRSARVGRKRKG